MKLGKMALAKVQVVATGTQLPRFLTLLLTRGILYEEAFYEGGKICLTMPAKQYRLAAYCARKTGIRLRIAKKQGAAFRFFRHRRRVWTLVPIALMVLAFLLIPQYIWRIDVVGTERLTQLEMRKRLEGAGVYEGMWRHSLDTAEVERELRLVYEDLSFLSLSLAGSVLEVRVRETVEAPEMVDRASPCDVIADQTCVVYSMVTESGKPMVQQGDVVQEGEVLIAGEVRLVDDAGVETILPARASGEIYGKRRVCLQEKMEAAYEKQIFGEAAYGGLRLRLGSWQGDVRNPLRKSEQEVQTEKTWLRLPIGSGLSISHMQYEPFEVERATYSREEMEKRLTERLERKKAQVLEEGESVVLEENLMFQETETGLEALLELVLMEQVGKPVEKAWAP